MTFTDERRDARTGPADQPSPAVGRHGRQALFSAGGAMGDTRATQGHSHLPARREDAFVEVDDTLSADEVVAGALFTTQPQDDPWIDLTDDLRGHARGQDPELLETMATASEAMEYVERARGHMYTLHHLLVRAEILFTEVSESLRAQGRHEEAEMLQREVIGRSVIGDRWSHEVVEEFDDGFHGPVADAVKVVQERTVGGQRHAREAEIKRRRRRIADPLRTPADDLFGR
jgi:hypothetical protein